MQNLTISPVDLPLAELVPAAAAKKKVRQIRAEKVQVVQFYIEA